MTVVSNLQRVLEEHRFAVTAEIGPPKGASAQSIVEKAQILKGYADAFNITDNQTAVVRQSSMAGCRLLLDCSMEPILQVTCRDRNRIALQSDVLGASALGIHNVLCVTGDHQSFGNHPQAKGVYDIDSIQMLYMFQQMRDQGIFQNGEPITKGNPVLFLGAACNPFAEPKQYRLARLEKKIHAGAQFIQTQSIFNIDYFCSWMDEVCSSGLHNKVFILAGVTPLKSVKMMQRMKYHVPGVDVPEKIEQRMVHASDPLAEGYAIALETIQDLKQVNGLSGVHITALFWESIIPKLVTDAGLYPR